MTVNENTALRVFQETAGISASHLSLSVRAILCTLFLLWAAWIIYGQIQVMQSKHHDIYELPVAILRVLLLCSLMVTLVFVK